MNSTRPLQDIDAPDGEWLASNILAMVDCGVAYRRLGRSGDDHAMGLAAWYALGDIAQLPAWNTDTHGKLGDRYGAVEKPCCRLTRPPYTSKQPRHCSVVLLATCRYRGGRSESIPQA